MLKTTTIVQCSQTEHPQQNVSVPGKEMIIQRTADGKTEIHVQRSFSLTARSLELFFFNLCSDFNFQLTDDLCNHEVVNYRKGTKLHVRGIITTSQFLICYVLHHFRQILLPYQDLSEGAGPRDTLSIVNITF